MCDDDWDNAGALSVCQRVNFPEGNPAEMHTKKKKRRGGGGGGGGGHRFCVCIGIQIATGQVYSRNLFTNLCDIMIINELPLNLANHGTSDQSAWYHIYPILKASDGGQICYFSV